MILAHLGATHKLFSDKTLEKLRVKMKKSIKVFLNEYLFVFGLLGVLLSLMPYLILGEDSVLPYHDQLDGELLAYIYQAKYLFSGSNMILEFMGGAAKTALVPPAPLAVFLFRIFPPFAALVVMQAVGQLVGYIGMFKLSEHFTDKKPVSFVAALLYAFLPFLPVYGLSQYGMPLLLLCIIRLYRGEKVKRSLIYVAVYAGMSSLVLCGFAWLVVWGVGLLWLILRRSFRKHKLFSAGFGLMLGVYVAENIPLLGQMIGFGGDFISHKNEYALAGGGFVSLFWNYLLHNSEHSEDSHIFIGCLAAAVILLILILEKLGKRKMERVGVQFKYLISLLGIIGVFCVVSALWDCEAFVGLKTGLGTLGSLQLDRILWLAPMLWLLVLVLCLDILWSVDLWVKWVIYAGSLIVLGCLAVVSLKNSLVKPCVQKLLRPDYNAISYSDYLAIGVMEQVEAFLAQNEGVSKEEYRVASLGIDPAAALYHGFYTVDGYSNNYDLEYKHAFRKVIAPELDKSEYLQDYYDNWGNRCYLFSAECPGYYTIEKGGFFFQSLTLNAEALKELGCDYILSAAYIVEPEQTGLSLLKEEAFETEDSYYRIFVYKVK